MIIIGYQGIGKSTLANRDLKYIDFVVEQMHAVETDPDYFRLLNESLADETGLNILNNQVEEGK